MNDLFFCTMFARDNGGETYWSYLPQSAIVFAGDEEEALVKFQWTIDIECAECWPEFYTAEQIAFFDDFDQRDHNIFNLDRNTEEALYSAVMSEHFPWRTSKGTLTDIWFCDEATDPPDYVKWIMSMREPRAIKLIDHPKWSKRRFNTLLKRCTVAKLAYREALLTPHETNLEARDGDRE